MRNYKILITQYESYEEFMEDIYENIDYNEVEDLIIRDYDTDEAMDLALEELINQYTDESFAGIYDGQELENWWRYNGWTLDKGYGGPNYKERLADSIDWDVLFDLIINSTEVNNSFGAITLTPVEINDWVIFGYDEVIGYYEDDDQESLTETKQEPKSQKDWVDNLKSGYLVAISACVEAGDKIDCSKMVSLEQDLNSMGFYFIETKGYFGSVDPEYSFQVPVDTITDVENLIRLGVTKYGQHDVYAWNLPLTNLKKAVEVNGKLYGTVLDKAIYDFGAQDFDRKYFGITGVQRDDAMKLDNFEKVLEEINAPVIIDGEEYSSRYKLQYRTGYNKHGVRYIEVSDYNGEFCMSLDENIEYMNLMMAEEFGIELPTVETNLELMIETMRRALEKDLRKEIDYDWYSEFILVFYIQE